MNQHEKNVKTLEAYGFRPRRVGLGGWNNPNLSGHDINVAIRDDVFELSFRRAHPVYGYRLRGSGDGALEGLLCQLKAEVPVDPDANLEEQRRIIERVTARDDAEEPQDTRDLVRLVVLTAALDEWISKGGALPAAWRRDA